MPSSSSPRRPAQSRTQQTRQPNGIGRFFPKWLRITLATLLALFLAGATALAVVYSQTEIPDPNAAAQAQKTTVYYADGKTELGSFAIANRTNIPLSQMPKSIQQALIASEDRTFYSNSGVSVTGIFRAVWNNFTGGSQQGGSTITQQYVKNYYLTSQKSYTRKLKEAMLAVKIDQSQSKDTILQNYLNTVFFGRGAYGVQAAAESYWGIPASKLTVSQSALLVGVLPSPAKYDPAVNPERAKERWGLVLDAMVNEGYLSKADRDKQVFPKAPIRKNDNDFAGPNGYLLQSVRDELRASGMTDDQIDGGGLRIISTFDAKMQKGAVDAMNNTDAFPMRNRPKNLKAALTAIDPATGAVRAMYGGPDYLKRQRNGATQDTAQAGSTFKPFTLLAALQEGYSLRSTFNGANGQTLDNYRDGSGRLKPIRNFGGSNYGYIDLLTATANSVNAVYVNLNDQVGPQKTMDNAIAAGVPKNTAGLNNYLSNVLGTASPHNIDMAHAFSTFAAEGNEHRPHFVDHVEQFDNDAGKYQTIYKGDTSGKQVFDKDNVADLVYAMQQVVRRGSGSYARQLGRPVAGKTGTSNEAMSAWFVGFTPQLSTAVSLYNTDDAGNPIAIPPFGGVGSITGGSFPTRIWTRFNEVALDGTEELQFPDPVYGGKFHGTPAPQPTTASPTSSAPTSSAPTSSGPTSPIPSGSVPSQSQSLTPGNTGNPGNGGQPTQPGAAVPTGTALPTSRSTAAVSTGPPQ